MKHLTLFVPLDCHFRGGWPSSANCGRCVWLLVWLLVSWLVVKQLPAGPALGSLILFGQKTSEVEKNILTDFI